MLCYLLTLCISNSVNHYLYYGHQTFYVLGERLELNYNVKIVYYVYNLIMFSW